MVVAAVGIVPPCTLAPTADAPATTQQCDARRALRCVHATATTAPDNTPLRDATVCATHAPATQYSVCAAAPATTTTAAVPRLRWGLAGGCAFAQSVCALMTTHGARIKNKKLENFHTPRLHPTSNVGIRRCVDAAQTVIPSSNSRIDEEKEDGRRIQLRIRFRSG